MPSTTSQRMHQQQQQRSDNPSISTSPTLNLISVAQRDAILQTQSLKIQQKTRKDHGGNVQLFIAWIQKNYPSHASSLLIPIQQQQKESIDYPHPQHATHDLNYTSPAITTLMLAYMSYCKHKKNNLGEATGQCASRTLILKKHDSLKHCATFAKKKLPADIWPQVQAFLSGYKKEHASKKQQGLTAEHEADPIPFALYCKICNWAINEGNIYVWCWTI